MSCWSIFIQAPGWLCGLVSISVNLPLIHLLFPLFQPQDIWAQPGRLNIQEYVELEGYHSYFKFCNVKKKRGSRTQEFVAAVRQKRKKKKEEISNRCYIKGKAVCCTWMTGTGTRSQPMLKVRKMRGELRLHCKHVMNSEQALNEKQTSFCSSSVWRVKKKCRRISTCITFYCDLFDINSRPDWHLEDILQSNCNLVAGFRPLLCKNTCSWATFIWEEQEKARLRWTIRWGKRCYPEDFLDYLKTYLCRKQMYV